MFNKFIEILKNELSLTLPGVDAQQLMAPLSREDDKLQKHDVPVRKGAVLVLLYEKNDTICITYIKRPIYNGYHSGQVSFPGGEKEPGDIDLQETALRETFEEIGVEKNLISIIGQLTPIEIFISNFHVFPYVGFIETEPIFSPDKFEVSYVIEIDLKDILNNANKILCKKLRNGKTYTVPAYSVGDELVWGATAMITSELVQVLRNCNFCAENSEGVF